MEEMVVLDQGLYYKKIEQARAASLIAIGSLILLDVTIDLAYKEERLRRTKERLAIAAKMLRELAAELEAQGKAIK